MRRGALESYALAMLSELSTSVDERIASTIVARARRRWLPLRLVPTPWMLALAKPTATLIRRRLARAAATTLAFAGGLLALVLLVSSV